VSHDYSTGGAQSNFNEEDFTDCAGPDKGGAAKALLPDRDTHG
jgi:hypothetical protein